MQWAAVMSQLLLSKLPPHWDLDNNGELILLCVGWAFIPWFSKVDDHECNPGHFELERIPRQLNLTGHEILVILETAVGVRLQWFTT